MAGFDISYVFQAIDKFTRPARNILRSTQRMMGGFERLNKVTKWGAELQQKNMWIMAGTDAAVVGLGISVLGTAGKFQRLKIAFDMLVDNPVMSTKIRSQLMIMSQKYGAATTQEFANSARTLLSVGVQAKNIVPTLREIARVSSLTDVPVLQISESIAKVFGGGRVSARYIRALWTRTNIRKIIMKELHLTTKEIGKMRKSGAIPLAAFLKAFFILGAPKVTAAFKGMNKAAFGQIRMSHTLTQAWTALLDTFQVFRGNLGEYLDKQFKITDGMVKLKNTLIGVNTGCDGFDKH